MQKANYRFPSELVNQILRFLLVGSITFGLDFAVLIVLTDYFNIHYLISAPVGFLGGSILNYFLSDLFVFERGRFKTRKIEFIMFLIITMLGVLLNNIIMYIGFGLLSINYKLTKVGALFFVTIFNFLTKKYLVFLK